MTNELGLLRDAIASLSDGIAVWDAQDRLVVCNEFYARLYGAGSSAQSLAGTPFRRVAENAFDVERVPAEFGGRRNDWVEKRVSLHLAGGGEPHQYQTRDGRWWRGSTRLMAGGGRVGLVSDISELKRAEDAHLALLQTSGELLWSLDLDGCWTYLNAATERFYGKQPGELIGHPFAELVARELQERDVAVFGRVFAGESIFDHETRHMRSDGGYVDLSFNAIARRDADGRVVGATGTARDVTERKRASAALHESIEKLRLAVETADLNYWEWDAATDLLRWGRTPDGAAGRALKWADYAASVHPDDREHYTAVGRQAIQHGEPFDVEYRIADANGSVQWFSARGVPMLDAGGGVYRMIGVSQDITVRKRGEEQVRYLAYHDPLTGLPNRRLLEDRLNQALYLAERRGGKLAAMLIDLDDFKQVNDSAGHRTGDAVLREVAQRLAGCVRRADTLARHGGDEFVIVIPDLQAESDCRVVAEKVLRAFTEAYEAEGRSYRLGASIGIAIFPSGGLDGDALLRNADAAMYRAKQLGRNQYRFHD